MWQCHCEIHYYLLSTLSSSRYSSSGKLVIPVVQTLGTAAAFGTGFWAASFAWWA